MPGNSASKQSPTMTLSNAQVSGEEDEAKCQRDGRGDGEVQNGHPAHIGHIAGSTTVEYARRALQYLEQHPALASQTRGSIAAPDVVNPPSTLVSTASSLTSTTPDNARPTTTSTATTPANPCTFFTSISPQDMHNALTAAHERAVSARHAHLPCEACVNSVLTGRLLHCNAAPPGSPCCLCAISKSGATCKPVGHHVAVVATRLSKAIGSFAPKSVIDELRTATRVLMTIPASEFAPPVPCPAPAPAPAAAPALTGSVSELLDELRTIVLEAQGGAYR